MRRLVRIVGVSVLVPACVVGCEKQQLEGFEKTVTVYGSYGYAVDAATGAQIQGPRYLRDTDAVVPATDSPEERLGLAVTVLLDDPGRAPRLGEVSYWAGNCGPGQRTDGVEIRGDTVTVRLAGVVPGHGRCNMTPAEREVQEQQIAWTVRQNLDPFAEAEPPLVRVVEADGTAWEAVADPSFIQPIDRPTE
jgi:hypothetical protein